MTIISQTEQALQAAYADGYEDGRLVGARVEAARPKLPPVTCKSWCCYGDGHPDQIHRQDQYCTSADLRVDLTRHPLVPESRYVDETGVWESGPDYILVHAAQDPDDSEPHLMLRRETDDRPVVSWEFTPEEARQLAEAMQLLLAQVEGGARRLAGALLRQADVLDAHSRTVEQTTGAPSLADGVELDALRSAVGKVDAGDVQVIRDRVCQLEARGSR